MEDTLIVLSTAGFSVISFEKKYAHFIGRPQYGKTYEDFHVIENAVTYDSKISIITSAQEMDEEKQQHIYEVTFNIQSLKDQ